MSKIILSEREKTAYWKELIIANLQGMYYDGMTEDDIISLYNKAERNIIKKAIQELIQEGKVEVV